jgi:hypothetical protein
LIWPKIKTAFQLFTSSKIGVFLFKSCRCPIILF